MVPPSLILAAGLSAVGNWTVFALSDNVTVALIGAFAAVTNTILLMLGNRALYRIRSEAETAANVSKRTLHRIENRPHNERKDDE